MSFVELCADVRVSRVSAVLVASGTRRVPASLPRVRALNDTPTVGISYGTVDLPAIGRSVIARTCTAWDLRCCAARSIEVGTPIERLPQVAVATAL